MTNKSNWELLEERWSSMDNVLAHKFCKVEGASHITCVYCGVAPWTLITVIDFGISKPISIIERKNNNCRGPRT